MVILAGSEKEFFDVLVTAVNAQCGWLAKKTIKRALWCEPLSSEAAQLYKHLCASRGPVDTVLKEPRHEPQQQPQQDNVVERVTEESEVECVMEENVGQQAQDNLQLSHRTGRARVLFASIATHGDRQRALEDTSKPTHAHPSSLLRCFILQTCKLLMKKGLGDGFRISVISQPTSSQQQWRSLGRLSEFSLFALCGWHLRHNPPSLSAPTSGPSTTDCLNSTRSFLQTGSK